MKKPWESIDVRGPVRSESSGTTVVSAAGEVQGIVHVAAYVTTLGSYRIVGAPYTRDPCVFNNTAYCLLATELRAAYYALGDLIGSTQAVKLVTGVQALGWLRHWQQGETNLPPWYNQRRRGFNRTPRLRKLQLTIHSMGDQVSFARVQTATWDMHHAGHQLAHLALGVVKAKHTTGTLVTQADACVSDGLRRPTERNAG
jgi:hypothetical protein